MCRVLIQVAESVDEFGEYDEGLARRRGVVGRQSRDQTGQAFREASAKAEGMVRVEGEQKVSRKGAEALRLACGRSPQERDVGGTAGKGCGRLRWFKRGNVASTHGAALPCRTEGITVVLKIKAIKTPVTVYIVCVLSR